MVISASTSVDVPHITNKKEPQVTSKENYPRCFVADTESVRFVLDTRANHTIVNDARHVYGYKPARFKVKGIGGDPTISSGRGFIGIPLKSEGGQTYLIQAVPVMHIPSCPYNLLPHQVLIKEMKSRNFQVKYCKHDDHEYVLEWIDPGVGTTEKQTLTCDIRTSGLFELFTAEGYEKFCTRIHYIAPE